MVISELEQLPEERSAVLRKHFGAGPGAVRVASAFPLQDGQRKRLEQVLTTVTCPDVALQFEQDESLLAGVHISCGDWVMAANIRDELRGFADLAHAE